MFGTGYLSFKSFGLGAEPCNAHQGGSILTITPDAPQDQTAVNLSF